jgi:C-terminal processing protease CtpA/Prc
MRLLHVAILLTFMMLLAGCSGGGSSSPAPTPIVDGGGGSGDGGSGGGDGSDDGDTASACGVAAQIDFVEAVTEDWYLWYSEMADVDKSGYDSAQAYLDARLAPLIEAQRDLFSRMTTITEDETSISSGAYIGFGFRSFTDSTRLFITDVFESGPAYAAGVRRGMELLAVDTGGGFETLDQLSARGATNEEIFGANEIGVTREFQFRYQGEELNIEVAKEELSPPALAGEPLLIEREGLTPVGYLNLRQFIDAALDPAEGYFSLADASQLFDGEGVTDLIVDLRYNGGGLLSVADTMMDLLAGVTAEGEPSFKIQVNDQHPDYNEDQGNWGIFDRLPETASPIRIAFITSGNTASASELVINGLAPHVEAVLIGADTYGKQVGQGRWDMHEQIEGLERADCDVALRLTAFELVNGENQGGYHQVGLDGTGRFTLCAAEDDITRAFGDPRETLVATALEWFGSGACPSAESGLAPQTMAQLRSKSAPWLPTEFIPERVDGNLR